LSKYFKLRKPRIGVAGINPHAGEGGMFGDEERLVISPAVKKAARRNKGIMGPVSPDVIFNEALNGKYDAVVSMYHDQALIPFKLLYFNTGVNLTLGLPFIRTSPDHGTAFDIAGRGEADPSSMIEAIKLAHRLTIRS
jgi:4-hydroxythreonine-4-phosphate dehydrogenase